MTTNNIDVKSQMIALNAMLQECKIQISNLQSKIQRLFTVYAALTKQMQHNVRKVHGHDHGNDNHNNRNQKPQQSTPSERIVITIPDSDDDDDDFDDDDVQILQNHQKNVN